MSLHPSASERIALDTDGPAADDAEICGYATQREHLIGVADIQIVERNVWGVERTESVAIRTL
jgi:hypothetical protein